MSRTNHYKNKTKREPYSDVHITYQLRITNALLKFCRDHGRSTGKYITSIESCAEALKIKDIKSAVKYYLEVPLGGNGCFNDWFPPVVFDNETGDYAWAVFESLTSEWSRLMQLSVE